MKRSKQGLAWLLALLLLVSALPETVLAAEETEREALAGEPLEEVIYYYGDPASAMVVTRDVFKADTLDEEDRPYVVFKEDGSYTIPLPSQTEFPTVVHFLADGQDYPIVFGNVSATAEIGGHLFCICLEEPENVRSHRISSAEARWTCAWGTIRTAISPAAKSRPAARARSPSKAARPCCTPLRRKTV